MSDLESVTLNIPNLVLEELRCFICKGYLSCSPICVLQDGSSICGSCSPTYSDAQVYPVLALEAVLRRTSFPCQFQTFGCIENVLFGKVADHQHKCEYRSFLCPLLTICPWKGRLSKFYDHFTEQHADFIKEKAEFTFDLDQNSEEIFMTVKDSFCFIIKYIYDGKEMNLKYTVGFCASNINYDVSLKSQLINTLNTQCLVSLETSKCSLYNEDFYKMQGASILNINKFLCSLGNPNSVTVAVKLKLVKFDDDNKKIENNRKVNLNVIHALKCNKCENYLVPPLYNFDGKVICCDCAKDKSNCSPLNECLLKRIIEALYPCRWKDCDFVAKSSNIKGHERTCQFRLYKCFDAFCGSTSWKRTDLIKHLKIVHGASYVDDIMYKTSFAKNYNCKYMFTIKEFTLIQIVHKMVYLNSLYTHIVKVKSFGDSVKIGTILNFEHEHCKLQSKELLINQDQELIITCEQLPPCFLPKDVLTVTAKFIIS